MDGRPCAGSNILTMLCSRDLRSENAVVVIGSGPAGAVATLLLTSAGVDVVLLEAGPAAGALGLTARVGGVTVARLHRALRSANDIHVTGDPGTILFEDLAPGGLTNHWSLAVPRFSRDDFLDARRAGEAHAWPLDYDELVPWYEWVEPLLRISGGSRDVPHLPSSKVRHVRALGPTWAGVEDAARLEGRGVAPIPYAYGAETTLTFSGTVFNAFVRLVKPALRSGHLEIRYGARAIRLECSDASKRVKAVIVREARSDHRVPCRAVVVAAGAVNTAKLLLQSTDSAFPEGLGNTHGVLGRYLHDHPIAKVEIDLASALSFQPAAYLTRASLDQSIPLYAATCLQWSGVRMLLRSIARGHTGRLPSCGFNVFGTMAPSEENFVALDPARPSPDGTPGLVLHVNHPAESGRTLVKARDQLIDLLDRAKLQPRMQKWMVGPVGSSVHFAGTCRMHASPRFGMLDRWNRMHAVPNVVVADSGAFTTGPEKNPVLTAMALAARASQRLAEDLRAGVI
jgi:choline dehydrogenase-like flavoprotein